MSSTPTLSRPPAPVLDKAPKTAPSNGSQAAQDTRKYWKWVLVSLALMLVGTLLARYVLTVGGTVEVRDVRWVGTDGVMMSAFLYIPQGATAKNPAPAIAIGEGGDVSKETFELQAIEFARRGFVVLAVDQTGWGFSGGVRNQNLVGGPDAITYLRTLNFVDKNRIGATGHSQGGGFTNGVATGYPDGYKSLVFYDARNAVPVTDTVALKKLRNVAITEGYYDEYSQTMFGVPTASMLPKSKAVQNLFGVTEDVVPGKLYGSIDDGSARMLYFTPATHIAAMVRPEAIGTLIDWFQRTLNPPKPLPPEDQISLWKDVGSLTAFAGLLMLIFPVGALLLKTPFFSTLAESVPEYKGFTGGRWWFGALVTVAIVVLTYFWSTSTAPGLILANPIFFQNSSNVYMFWYAIVGGLTIVFLFINHFTFGRRNGATGVNYGLTWAGKGLDWGKIAKSLLLAICIVIPMYVSLAIAYGTTLIDFRGLAMLAIKILNPERFKAFLDYLIPYSILFIPLSISLHAFLRPPGGKSSFAREWLINAVMLTIGIVVLLLVEYIPYFFVYASLPIAPGGSGGWVVRLYAFLVLLPLVAANSTYFYRKTGHIWVGAFLNTLFITWYITCSQNIDAVMW